MSPVPACTVLRFRIYILLWWKSRVKTQQIIRQTVATDLPAWLLIRACIRHFPAHKIGRLHKWNNGRVAFWIRTKMKGRCNRDFITARSLVDKLWRQTAASEHNSSAFFTWWHLRPSHLLLRSSTITQDRRVFSQHKRLPQWRRPTRGFKGCLWRRKVAKRR